jgi:ribonucleoside-diphosphate reductase alpha chain
MPAPMRRRLPETRKSNIFETTIVGSIGSSGEAKPPVPVTIIAGEFDDHTIGEIFIKADIPGSKARGFADATCRLASKCLQNGVPLGDIVADFRRGRFEPAGRVTGHPTIKTCSSMLDLVELPSPAAPRETGDGDG